MAASAAHLWPDLVVALAWRTHGSFKSLDVCHMESVAGLI